MPVAAVATAAGATSCEPSTTTTITTTGTSTGAAAAMRSPATPTLRAASGFAPEPVVVEDQTEGSLLDGGNLILLVISRSAPASIIELHYNIFINNLQHSCSKFFFL